MRVLELSVQPAGISVPHLKLVVQTNLTNGERRTGLRVAGSNLLSVDAPRICDGRRPDGAARFNVRVAIAEHQVYYLLPRDPLQFGEDHQIDGAHGARGCRLVTCVCADTRESDLLNYVGARRLHRKREIRSACNEHIT